MIDQAQAAGRTTLEEGEVVEVGPPGGPVGVALGGGERVSAVLLDVAEGATLRLREGDRVLLHRLAGTDGQVVVGRLPAVDPEGTAGEATAAGAGSDDGGAWGTADGVEPPDELVIEAGRKLTLRVGEGSLTIREDGTIVLKGRDLVSHATRRNRIRGGSVSIN